MADYPDDIMTFRTIANLPNQTYDENNQTTIYKEDIEKLKDEIISIQEIIGTNPTGSYDNIKDRLGSIETDILSKEDSIGYTPENVSNKQSDLSPSSTKYPTVNAVNDGLSELLETIYPVGIVVTLGVSTNPATLFGIGTWTAITGKVIVGKASSGTFNTLNATGGEETHTLTISEMPAHDHGDITSNTVSHPFAGPGSVSSAVRDGGSHAAPRAPTQGGGQAHNNLQPYIVKYVWERTA